MTRHLEFIYAALNEYEKMQLVDVAANVGFRDIVEEATESAKEALLETQCGDDINLFAVEHAAIQSRYEQLNSVLDLLKVMNYDLIIKPQSRSDDNG